MVAVSISWFRVKRDFPVLPMLPIGEREATD